MSDFDIFLEGMLNPKFIEQSVLYYDDKFTCLEIEDNEAGLTGEFSEADVRNLNKDRAEEHGAAFKSLRYPDRVGTNYQRSEDALSCYKIHPKGEKAQFWK